MGLRLEDTELWAGTGGGRNAGVYSKASSDILLQKRIVVCCC